MDQGSYRKVVGIELDSFLCSNERTRIEPKLDLIKEISSKSDITRLIIVQYYYSGCNPGYAFEKSQVKILADINAEIDMDIYCLNDD